MNWFSILKRRPKEAKQMLKFLKHSFYSGDAFDREAAVYWFATDNHEGQSSALYSVLSTSPYKPSTLNKKGIADEGSIAFKMYEALEDFKA